MQIMFTVYWGPGGKNLGAFPSCDDAEAFIVQVMQNNSLLPYERHEFDINEIAYQPDPATIDL
jgi:hypothetical protein